VVLQPENDVSVTSFCLSAQVAGLPLVAEPVLRVVAADAGEAHGDGWRLRAFMLSSSAKASRCHATRARPGRIASDNWEKGLAREFVPLSSSD
jgi:hypothetical protein